MKVAAKDIHIAIAYCLQFIILISSCDNKEQSITLTGSPKPAYAPPVSVSLDTVAPPKRMDLKNAPPPRVVKVPKTTGGFNIIQIENGREKIQLQPPEITEAIPPQANFTNFNTEHGLASSSIFCGMMDKSGELWFSTGNYISRYDGAGFLPFTLGQGSPVNSILEDKNGHLWFTTWGGGIYHYDGVKIANFTTREGLGHDMTVKIIEDKRGNLWISTYGGGISRYDAHPNDSVRQAKSFTNFNTGNGLVSDYVSDIEEDKKGNIWFGTFGNGVCRFDGKQFKTYTTEQGLANNNVFSIIEDKRGIIWVGTYEGISRYDPAAGGTGFTPFDLDDKLLSKNVNDILEDRSGNIWFATIGGGACSYDGTGFTIFTTEQGLPNNNVSTITEDKNGNLWFGTSDGLSRSNGISINVFTSKQGLPKRGVLSIAEDKTGNLWFGTGQEGVSCFDGNKFVNYTTAQGLAGDIVVCILPDNENLWFTTNGGISCFDGKSFTSYTTEQGLAHNGVNNIMLDKNGTLWCGTHEGASRIELSGSNPNFTNYTTLQGFPNNLINVIAEGPDGHLWFGTEGGGVSLFDGKIFTTYTTKQGLAHNIVKSILKDKSGNLWFGTAGGVSRFDGFGFISYTTTQGLADDIVPAMVEDELGVLWFGTAKGFCSLKFKTAGGKINPGEIKGAGLFKESNEQLHFYEPVWEIYNNQTGYPVKEFNDRSMYIKRLNLPYGKKNDPGVIWGSFSDESVIRFDPKAEFVNTSSPVVFIRSVKIDENTINWYSLDKSAKDSAVIVQQEAMVYGKLLASTERESMQEKFGNIQFDSIPPFYQLPLNLVLPYEHNQVSIDFGVIETGRNFIVRHYQYILEGYDKEWYPVTENASASFGNISEGRYTFKVKARNPGGAWSEPVSYSFKVLPPWWRTWWFRILMGICFLFFLYGIYRWRTAALHQQKRKLERTVKERTAEVTRQKAEVERQKDVIEKEKEKSDELLLNILPSEVAEELKAKGHTTAKSYDEVTVLFSDIKGFTNVAEKMTAQELVKEIDTYFSAFDRIIVQHGLEKIKTIGDAYIAAGGLPENNPATARHVVEAAIAMQEIIGTLKQERLLLNKPYFELRIGIHTGPVVAGVVGIKKFQYDIWGDTVNLAARMEQSGVPGKINISQHTYELVKEKFHCIPRGKIDAKNKGQIEMYFVEGK